LLEAFLNIAPAVILFTGMIGVGFSMTRRTVLSVTAEPGSLLSIIVLQIVLLPVAGIVTVLVTDPPPAVALAILLIAACPGGGISNLYVLFARANTSLSVLMTLSTLALASLSLPGTLAVIRRIGFETIGEGISLAALLFKLMAIVVIPVAIGMAVRAYSPSIALRWGRHLSATSALMIVVILATALWVEGATVLTMLPQILLSVTLFLGLALAIGALAGWVFYSSSGDRFAVMTEFAVRNLTIGLFVSVGLSGSLNFAGPAAIYLLLEAIALLCLAQARRYRLKRSATDGALGDCTTKI
jgi:BASS family bile acid:Na+ symporter